MLRFNLMGPLQAQEIQCCAIEAEVECRVELKKSLEELYREKME